MKRLLAVLLILLISFSAFAARRPRPEPEFISPRPGHNGYTSFTLGYNALISNTEGDMIDHYIPFGAQTGYLTFNRAETYAFGPGFRTDFGFGFDEDDVLFSADFLLGLDNLIVFNEHFQLDILAGLAMSIIEIPDSSPWEESEVFTLGPGASVTFRISPFANEFYIDAGLAVYGHFSLDSDYMGASVLPYIGFSIDLTRRALHQPPFIR